MGFVDSIVDRPRFELDIGFRNGFDLYFHHLAGQHLKRVVKKMKFLQDIYLVFMLYITVSINIFSYILEMHLQIEFRPIVRSTILKFMTLAAIFHPQR